MTRPALLRRAGGLVLAAITATLGVAAAAPVADAAPRAEAQTIDVQITNLSPAVLSPGEDLEVDVTLRNDSTQPVAHPRASLLLWRYNLTSRSALTTSAAGEDTRTSTLVASVDSPAALQPGQSVPLHLTLAAAKVGLRDTRDAWGPRGMAVEGGDGADVLGVQRTFLLWQPSGFTPPQADLTVLVPVVGPQVGTPESASGSSSSTSSAVDPATADRLASLTASGGRLDAVRTLLSDPASRDATAVVDPQVLGLAHDAGGSASAWSTAVSSALGDHDVASLPWADVDAAATVHGARPDLTASAVTRSDAAHIPGRRAGTVLWAATSPDRATASLVPSLGVLGLVLPVADARSTAAADRALPAVQSAATDAGDAKLLVPDPVLTALFTDPTSVESGATTATATQRLLAELAVVAHRGSSSTALVAPARDWQPDPALVGAELEAVSGAPWSRVAPLSSLLDAKSEPATLPRITPTRGELEPAGVQALDDARQRAVAFSGVTTEPAAVLDTALDSVLPPLSVAWRDDPAGRDALVSKAVTGISTATTGLSIAPLSDINVISTSSDIRVGVHNDLAVNATVHLTVTPRKACLEVTQPAPFTVAAHAEVGVVVQLHAAANCQVTVEARLTNPSGLDVAAPVRFTARVAPTIENVGTIVVGILLAIGLVLGIARTIRRGQSARRGARLEAEAADAPVVLAPLGGVSTSETPVVPSPAADPRDALGPDDAPGPEDAPASDAGGDRAGGATSAPAPPPESRSPRSPR